MFGLYYFESDECFYGWIGEYFELVCYYEFCFGFYVINCLLYYKSLKDEVIRVYMFLLLNDI